MCGHEFEGFVDDGCDGSDVLGPYTAVRDRMPPARDRGIVVAIGYKDLDARWRICARLRDDGYTLPALTHSSAWVHAEAQIGAGTLIGAGATVDAVAQVGPFCVLWPGVIVSHDAKIGENTFLSPGAVVCGCADVGRQTFVGAGAVIPDLATVPASSFVRPAASPPGRRRDVARTASDCQRRVRR